MGVGTLLRESWNGVARRPKLIAWHLLGNAALFALFFAWLSLPDRTAADLALTVLLGAAVAFGALLLHGSTMALFHDALTRKPCAVAVRRLHLLLLWAAALAATALIFWWLGRARGQPLWILGLFVSLALLPLVSQAAGGGFDRASALAVTAKPSYWLTALVFCVMGVFAPGLLVSWTPETTGIANQTLSMLARFGAACMLAVVAWLVLVAVIGKLGSAIQAETARQPAG